MPQAWLVAAGWAIVVNRPATLCAYDRASALPQSCAMHRVYAFLALILSLAAVPAHAGRTVVSESYVVEEWIDGAWVEVDAGEGSGSDRFVLRSRADAVEGIADYGPFRVLDEGRAALVGITDQYTPAQFAAMLRDFPAIGLLEMIECPGTLDDRANLRLGRMIRERGIATHVPGNGSVRSGAVELFLAGADRTIDDGARFAVHAWLDDAGYQPGQYGAQAPENRKYLTYYREMGMTPEDAAAFYAMTNSVPNEDALWLSAQDMRLWVATDGAAQPAPRLAYLDLGLLLN
jgi:hypothetical protein